MFLGDRECDFIVQNSLFETKEHLERIHIKLTLGIQNLNHDNTLHVKQFWCGTDQGSSISIKRIINF